MTAASVLNLLPALMRSHIKGAIVVAVCVLGLALAAFYFTSPQYTVKQQFILGYYPTTPFSFRSLENQDALTKVLNSSFGGAPSSEGGITPLHNLPCRASARIHYFGTVLPNEELLSIECRADSQKTALASVAIVREHLLQRHEQIYEIAQNFDVSRLDDLKEQYEQAELFLRETNGTAGLNNYQKYRIGWDLTSIAKDIALLKQVLAMGAQTRVKDDPVVVTRSLSRFQLILLAVFAVGMGFFYAFLAAAFSLTRQDTRS